MSFSSYSEPIDLAPAMDTLASGVEGGIQGAAYGIQAGGVIALVGGVAVASVAFGSAWVLYKSGRYIFSEAEHYVRETNERNERLNAEEALKQKRQQNIRIELIKKCEELENSCQKVFALNHMDFVDETVSGFLSKIDEIRCHTLEGSSQEMALQNEAAQVALENLSKNLDGHLSEMVKNRLQETKDRELLSAMEALHIVSSAFKRDRHASGHDIVVDAEAIRRKKSLEVLSEAVVALYNAINHERMRELQMPVDKEHQAYLHQLFDGADIFIQKLYVESEKTAISEIDYLGSELNKRLNQYALLKLEMDKDEEIFKSCYQAYSGVCKGLGDECREPLSFSSISELRMALEEKDKRIERMAECVKIYKNLGRDAYICYALDKEMKALGYSVVEREFVQDLFGTDPNQAVRQNCELPYYDTPDHKGMTQVYEVSENVYVQVVIDENGATSVETFHSGTDNIEYVVEEQKKHCEKNKKLEKALKEKWFIGCNLEEVIPPEEVNHRHVAQRHVGEDIRETASDKTNDRYMYIQQ